MLYEAQIQIREIDTIRYNDMSISKKQGYEYVEDMVFF